MKSFAPLLLIVSLACSSTTAPDRSTVPATELATASTLIPQVDVTCTDWCQGSNAWWGVAFDLFGVENLDHATLRVYAVNWNGERAYFGLGHEGRKGADGTHRRFYVQGKAPAIAMTDIYGEELPPSNGWVAFHVEVYDRQNFIGTASNVSDVPLTSNLCPGVCVGLPHGSTPQIQTSCAERGKSAASSRE